MLTRRLVTWFDDRLGGARYARKELRKAFPDHWSFLFGEIALYAFVVLLATGVYLSIFFDPSLSRTTYEGSYEPLRGVTMSEAYRSAVELSFDVRAGLVMRQIHHWAALVMVAAVLVHLCRIFFTGAFRRPRELNWMVGVTLLLLVVVNGFAGYSLLDDLLSGTGLRIAYSIGQSIPLIGPHLVFFVFGGEFPAHDIITRLFVIHILIVPGLIIALIGVHMAVLWRQKHTQFPGPGRTERNVVGQPLWPKYAAKSIGLLLLVAAVLSALGGLVQINPVWLWGPFEPYQVAVPAQPDWYVGWVEGALRLFPAWRIELGGFEIPEPFWPAVFVPLVTLVLLYAWPFLEARATGDHAEHHLLDRPRDHPVRTAMGVTTIAFYSVMFFAGANDVIAMSIGVPVNAVTRFFQVGAFALPALLGVVTYSWAKALRDQAPPVTPSAETTEEVGAPPEDVGRAPGGPRPAEPELLDEAGGEEGEDAGRGGLGRVLAALGLGALAGALARRRRSRRRRGGRGGRGGGGRGGDGPVVLIRRRD